MQTMIENLRSLLCNNAVADIRLGGQQVAANAEELKKLAEKLTKLTQRFNV